MAFPPKIPFPAVLCPRPSPVPLTGHTVPARSFILKQNWICRWRKGHSQGFLKSHFRPINFLQDPTSSGKKGRVLLVRMDGEPVSALCPGVLFEGRSWLKWLLSPKASPLCLYSTLPNHTASPSFGTSVWWRVRKLDSVRKKATQLLTIGTLLFYKLRQFKAKGLSHISCALLYYRYWITGTLPGEQN